MLRWTSRLPAVSVPNRHVCAHPFPLGVALVVALSLTVPCDAQSSLHVLADRTESLQARIDMIQRAQCSIDLCYYSLDTDEVPVAILDLLRRSADRGVRVRILVDGLKSRLPSKFEKYLRRFGIQVRVYHPPQQGHPRWLNRRLHSKLIVVDGSFAVIGSSNLENEHYPFTDHRQFIDCDALVSGEVANCAQAYFDRLWQAPDVSRAPDHDSLGLDILRYRPYGRSDWKEAWRDAREPADYQRLLTKAVDLVSCHSNVTFASDRDWIGESTHGVQVGLLYDRSFDKSENCVQTGIIEMMDGASRTLLIESPYPAFDRPVRAAISRARDRGVCVTILTNSLKSTDQLNVYAAYQNQKRGLLREGVHLREMCGDDILHAKTMIVDNSRWMIGSYNFDARSDNLNLELCLVSDDPAGAAQLRATLTRRLSQSVLITEPSLLLPVGLDATLGKRLKLAAKRTYIELIRGFL